MSSDSEVTESWPVLYYDPKSYRFYR